MYIYANYDKNSKISYRVLHHNRAWAEVVRRQCIDIKKGVICESKCFVCPDDEKSQCLAIAFCFPGKKPFAVGKIINDLLPMSEDSMANIAKNIIVANIL
jgi:hypothetical protein